MKRRPQAAPHPSLGSDEAIDIGAMNAKFDLILASNNDMIYFHPKYLGKSLPNLLLCRATELIKQR